MVNLRSDVKIGKNDEKLRRCYMPCEKSSTVLAEFSWHTACSDANMGIFNVQYGVRVKCMYARKE